MRLSITLAARATKGLSIESCKRGVFDGHNSTHEHLLGRRSIRLCDLAGGPIGRPPDHGNAQFILLISAHLESGHYFNPHAQRIIEGMMNGAKLAVMDTRLSNTASMADYWMPTYPGSEAAVLLAMAKIIIEEKLYNEKFLRDWVNWRESLVELRKLAESDRPVPSASADGSAPRIEPAVPSSESLSFDEFISELESLLRRIHT